MCNSFQVSLMLHNLDSVEFEVGKEKTDMMDIEYREVHLGKDFTAFMNEDQIRELIDKMAKATYGKTWGELEDEKLFAEIDKEEAEQDLQMVYDNVSNF